MHKPFNYSQYFIFICRRGTIRYCAGLESQFPKGYPGSNPGVGVKRIKKEKNLNQKQDEPDCTNQQQIPADKQPQHAWKDQDEGTNQDIHYRDDKRIDCHGNTPSCLFLSIHLKILAVGQNKI